MTEARPREIDVTERPAVPKISLLLGFGPILLIAVGAVTAWLTKDLVRDEVIIATGTYAAGILIFIAGVRRGLSFRTEGGPAFAQLATMLVLFVLALFALMALGNTLEAPAVITLAVGFVLVLILDPLAARNGQAPLFFARLRPPQMLIAIVGLLILLANILLRG